MMRVFPLLYVLLLTFFPLDTWAQFPGYEVQHFNSENGMPNTVKGMQLDRDGFVWLATEAGLVRFDGTRFRLFDRSEDGLPINRLYNVGIAADGKIFTLVQDKGYYFITASNTLKSISSTELFQHQVSPWAKFNFGEQLRVGYSKQYKAGRIGDQVMPAWGKRNSSFLNSVVRVGGYYYYISTQNEIVVTDTAFTSFNPVALHINKAKNRVADSLQPMSLFSQHSGIFLRKDDTLYKLDFSSDKKTAVATPMLFIGNIPNVIGILPLPDSSTTLVATSTDGFYLFRKQPFNTVNLANREANVFYAQAPFGEDAVLTSKGIIQPGSFIPLQHNFFAYSVLKTRDNHYYMHRRDLDTFSLCLFDHRLEKIKEIPIKGGINCMQEGEDGTIWLSASGRFLGRVDNDHIQWFDQPSNLPAGFEINIFSEISPNTFWVGGKLGLAKVDLMTREVQVIPGLTNTYVRSLYRDTLGILWIGTYGSGFYAWYNHELVKFPTDELGYLNYVHTFMPDKSGRLWLSTNHGLFVIALKDLHEYLQVKNQAPYYYYFDHTAGFLTNEFNGGCTPAGIQLGNGKFSLPTLNGLVQFFPDSIQVANPQAKIFVDHITADTTVIPITGQIIIPQGKTRLRFFIASPYYGNSYNQHIEYKIGKASSEWYTLNDEHMIELNNLTKGEHALVLRKQAGFGSNNFLTTEINFTVQPFYYETIFFKGLVGAVVMALLFFLYKLRIRLLIQQRKRLEQEVVEKTKEQLALINNLESLVAELEQSKDDLKKTVVFKENLATILTHDLQSPLRFLSNAMDRLNELQPNAEEEVAELNTELKKTSAYLYHFVLDFNTWVKKVSMPGKMDLNPINITDLLSELEIFFVELLKNRGNKLLMLSSQHTCILADYQLLKITIRNIIDNANKHTSNGMITVQLEAYDDNASITITDNGTGIKPELLQKIIRYTQLTPAFNYDKEMTGIGLGYRFVTDFCRMQGISLKIDSHAGKGTIVNLLNLKVCKYPQEL